MEDLILQFGTFGVSKPEFINKEPHQQLLQAKELASKVLIERLSNKEVKLIYYELETFNLFVKERVSFNIEDYSDNHVLQKIIKQCDDYYNLAFMPSVNFRERILNCLLLYDNMLMCV